MITTEQERIEYLRQTANILTSYAEHDIIYGDVKDDNILINKRTGKIKFCDIDNMQVEDLPIDVMGHGLIQYYNEVQCIDKKTDAYMHNLFLLEQLRYKGLCYNTILNHLAFEELNPSFPDEVMHIINTLNTPQDFKGEYAIKYIKKR